MLDVVKIKRIIFSSAVMVVLAFIIVLADRHYMTVRWDGRKDVLVRFDQELNERKARVISYSNEPVEHIKQTIRLHTDDESVGIQDYRLPSEPYEENDEIILSARGSGQRSILRTDYEGWCYGFLAEVVTLDGSRLYAWTEAEPEGDDLLATFSIKNSQQ